MRRSRTYIIRTVLFHRRPRLCYVSITVVSHVQYVAISLQILTVNSSFIVSPWYTYLSILTGRRHCWTVGCYVVMLLQLAKIKVRVFCILDAGCWSQRCGDDACVVVCCL
jgi:hypothetical protein